jgi:tetratricopeptide (TPR) repeat protein
MPRMEGATQRRPRSRAMRLAQEAWRVQHIDSKHSFALAQAALERAQATADHGAEYWARLARGHHFMRYHSPADGERELALARQGFAQGPAADRQGDLLAAVGIARCWWMQGRFRESLDLVLPLRDEGLRCLQQDERGMLLNGIAGCYSALGDSAQAFAYMYQALRECKPNRGHGFDVVLYCNLAHELYQLGDYDQALSYLDEGLERSAALANPRLTSVLLTNRVVCYTDLGRSHEALPDIERVLALPADSTGRGASGAAFELMAVAALRAGQIELGRTLVQRARAQALDQGMPDAQVDLAVAEAELLMHDGAIEPAVQRLERELPADRLGLSLRARCLLLQALADTHERLGHTEQALAYLRQWQPLHLERARLASRSRCRRINSVASDAA